LLRELFRLRSATSIFMTCRPCSRPIFLYERERIALQRTQAEVLARFVYVTILSFDELTAFFADDAWLYQLWATRDDEASKFWGRPWVDSGQRGASPWLTMNRRGS
jgi:hypothetical protein